MPKIAKELSDAQVRRLKPKNDKPTYFAVGGVAGLLLQCRPPAPDNDTFARSWILSEKVGDKRRDIGMGGYPDTTLSMARERAREAKELIRQGIDPVAQRRAARSALMASQAKEMTFKQVALSWVGKKAKEFKTAVQAEKLTSRLEMYVYPHIGNMLVGDIERAHIINMLAPIWEEKTETATRVRAYVERILDTATAEGLRTGENPARWKGNLDLSPKLAAPNKITKVEHFK